jgi:hypothetical protein
MSADDDVAPFIASSFRSVWSLELLLLLKGDRRPWPHEELVIALRASELVVTQALRSLVAAGLAFEDEDGTATYMPASRDLERLVEETEQLYARKPDAVRRTIVASSSSGLSAFADAFRLRKD